MEVTKQMKSEYLPRTEWTGFRLTLPYAGLLLGFGSPVVL